MQFPVPQFTDVEDKIIGPLTIKQFGIVFAVGVVVFLGFSLTKSFLVGIFLFLLLGLPGLGLAFIPYNGRPIYSSLGKLVKFFLSPKMLTFHREAQGHRSPDNFTDAQISVVPPTQPESSDIMKLRTVQDLLRKTAAEESKLLKK